MTAFVATPRRALTAAKVAGIATIVGVFALGVHQVTSWSPFGHHGIHVPAISHTVTKPDVRTLELDKIIALHALPGAETDYTWTLTTWSEKTTAWVIHNTKSHEVTVHPSVYTQVITDGSGGQPAVSYSETATGMIVYWLPPPTVETVSIDPTTQSDFDKCTLALPLSLTGFSDANFPESCSSDPLAYQTQAIASVKADAQKDPSVLAAGRSAAADQIACLVGPTGMSVAVQWDDQPAPLAYTPLVCPTPLQPRFAPSSTVAP